MRAKEISIAKAINANFILSFLNFKIYFTHLVKLTEVHFTFKHYEIVDFMMQVRIDM